MVDLFVLKKISDIVEISFISYVRRKIMSSFFAGQNNSSFDYDEKFGEMVRLLERLVDVQEKILHEIRDLRRDMQDQNIINGKDSRNW